MKKIKNILSGNVTMSLKVWLVIFFTNLAIHLILSITWVAQEAAFTTSQIFHMAGFIFTLINIFVLLYIKTKPIIVKRAVVLIKDNSTSTSPKKFHLGNSSKH